MRTAHVWQIVFWLAALAVLLAGCAQAQPRDATAQEDAVLLSDSSGFYNLAPQVTYLEDPDGELTIEEVLSLTGQAQSTVGDPFQPSRSATFNRGLNTSVFWLRIMLKNEQAAQQDWRLEISPSSIDFLEVYLPRADGRVSVWETGDQQPFLQREIAYRSFVFTLDLPQGDSQVIYVRFQNKAQTRLNLSLWSDTSFSAFQTREQFFLGLFYGSLFVVWNYSLLLLLSLRQRVPWHFSMLLAALCSSLLLFVADGLAYWLVWPEGVWLNDAALLTLWALTGAAIFRLVEHFTKIETGTIPFRWFLTAGSFGWLVLAALNLLFNHWVIAWSVQLFTIPSMLLLIIVGVRLLPILLPRQRVYLALLALLIVANLPLVFSYLVPGFFVFDPLLSARFLTLVIHVTASLVIRARYDSLVQNQLEAEQAIARAASENERLIRHYSNHLASQVEKLNRELTALLDLTVLVNDDRNWEELLGPMLNNISRASQLDAVAVFIRSDGSETLELLAQIGLPESIHPSLVEIAIPAYPAAETLETGSMVQMRELNLDGFNQQLSLVLMVHSAPLGLLAVYRKQNVRFTPDQVAVLAAFASYLSVKIENQRLRLQAERSAIDQERQRIARDLHDSLNQSIYSLALLARASRDAQDEGEMVRLSENLSLLEEYAKHALGEMRLLLFQLRPPELETSGLAGALEARFNLVERRAGLEAEIIALADLRLPQTVEIELYRISIEALNNSLRHARATRVLVTLLLNSDRCLEMRIEDNGVGFDPLTVPQGMGLMNMRARASTIQAQLDINALPGGGTRLCVITRPLEGEFSE